MNVLPVPAAPASRRRPGGSPRHTQLQQGRLVRLAREIELRIGRVLERLLVKLPIRFIHGGLPRDKVLDGSRITQI